MKHEPHGVPGQCNIYTLDVDSEITSFGKHNRLLVFGNRDGTVTIREDLREDLPLSTEVDRQRAAKGYQRIHPRFSRLHPIGTDTGERAIEHHYQIAASLIR